MKTGQEPIRVSYRSGIFRLEAHLLISLDKTYWDRGDQFRQLIRASLQEKWQKSFPVDQAMKKAILEFLEARCPETIPGFLHDLHKAQEEALTSYQSRAAAELAQYLAALKQLHTIVEEQYSLNQSEPQISPGQQITLDQQIPPSQQISPDQKTSPDQQIPPNLKISSGQRVIGPASFSLTLSAEQKKLSSLNGRHRLSRAELVPKMSLQIFVSEEKYTGRIPLAHFIYRVLQGARRPLLVYVKNLKYRPSHVQSSFFRRGWGIFRDGRVISLGFNWHYRWPGLMRLAGAKSAHYFKREMAHEFGHTMGLGDAYAAWYRSYDAYPGSESYLMHSNRDLSSEEIRMVFQAQATGHLQHFPYKWSWPKFRQGFRREVNRLADKFSSK